MKRTFKIEGLGTVSVTDTDYLCSGGEGQIYIKDNQVLKIYHDTKDMIPLDKIKELEKIKAQNVLKPERVIYEGSTPVGYTMTFIKNTHSLCKLFTKAFKMRNGLSNEDITNLVSIGQDTMEDVHRANCLIVDFNEMNG